MIRALFAMVAALLLATPALAARDFRIAGQAFAESDILDARGLASLGGEPAVLVTLAEPVREAMHRLSAKHLGAPLPVTLDGRVLATNVMREPVADGVIELTGFTSFEEGEAIAKLIAGKAPLPDSMDD